MNKMQKRHQTFKMSLNVMFYCDIGCAATLSVAIKLLWSYCRLFINWLLV